MEIETQARLRRFQSGTRHLYTCDVSEKKPTLPVDALGLDRGGDEQAASALFPRVYAQLRRIAGSYFRGQNREHTLQPTALVHEAFLRLVRKQPGCWNDRTHFIAIAAVAMRQILVEHARKRSAQKRGGNEHRIPMQALEKAPDAGGAEPLTRVDILALDAALSRLQTLAPRQARIIELQYFGGLTVEETAQVLGVSKGLVEKDWRRARAFLRSALAEGEPA
jgi:RNA polymerase sigma factor (TIGR02999 family)